MTSPASGYPCPACGVLANLDTGCPGCARGPDPVAAEVIQLDRRIAELTGQVEQAQQTYLGLAAGLRDARARREDLAGRVRAVRSARPPAQRSGAAPAAGPLPDPVPGPAPAARPETSTRTVQNLLFIFGGVLLGAAAVVFTAVAWASVGIAGRALILLALTALALIVPLLAARRGLTATAETFAAVGLLLVVLDGYAAWTVDLFGVAGWPAARFAALVAGVSTTTAVGYAVVSRLRAPWFGALLAGQPVLPLLAVDTHPGPGGWSLVCAAVAVLDLAVVARLTAAGTGARSGASVAGRATAWVGYGTAQAGAGICGLTALAAGEVAGSPLLAGVPLLVAALSLAAAARLARRPRFGALAGATLVVAIGAAAVRPVAELRPSVLLIGAALVVVLLTLAVQAAGRALPAAVRVGPRAGALVTAGLVALAAVAITVTLAGAAVLRSMPPWHGAPAGPRLSFGWQLPAALLLATASVAALLPSVARVTAITIGGTLAVLAVPALAPAPWPAVVAVEVAAGLVAMFAAVARPAARPVDPALRAGAAAVLTGHALLVSLAAPGGAATVLAVLLPVGLAAAGLARDRAPSQRAVGGAALTVALLAAPVGAAVGLFAAGAAPWWQARAALAATLLPLVALVAARRHAPVLSGYAASALGGAALVTGLLFPLVAPGAEPLVLYAAAGALLVTLGRAVLRSASVLRLTRAVLLLATGVCVLPAVWAVLVAPYGWLGEIWSGTPAGVGLAPKPVDLPGLSAGVALLLLAGTVVVPVRDAAVLRGRGAGAPLVAVLPLAAVALPVLLAGAGAPWPAVPAVTLCAGLAALLTAAVRPAPWWLVPVGSLLVGPGLAGLLAARGATLAGLGLVVVVAVTSAVSGRSAGARIAGWSGATAAGTVLAVAAPLAADLPLRTAGFAVLGVAALALGAATFLRARRPVEAFAGHAASQATALVALLLTLGWPGHAAAVCTLWGAAVGVRAVWPGEPARYRWRLAAIAGGSELLALWLLLSAERVALLEAYTLPAAALVLVAGWLAVRARPTLSSWVAYGPGLGAALLPSLASVLVAGEQPVRRLLLGVGALAVVLAGAVRRRQAPVVVGGAALVLVALHEVVLSWDLLPRWIYLAAGGFALIGLATTYERRRRDLARLRAAVGRMS